MVSGNIDLWRELKKIWKFGAIGFLSTVIHLTLVAGMIFFLGINVLHANFLAFVIAVSVSFFGHYHWTFRSQVAKSRSFIKFLVIAAIAFFVNNTFLVTLLGLEYLTKIQSVMIAVLIIPVITFTLSRLWVFR